MKLQLLPEPFVRFRGPFSLLAMGLALLSIAMTLETQADDFGLYPDAPVDLYPRVEQSSVYVPDASPGDEPGGTRLAIDLFLPMPRKAKDRFPTLVMLTRYWRSAEVAGWAGGAPPVPWEVSFFVRRGYAVVYGDVRGTGASFGSRTGPWGEDEVRDGKNLVDWIVGQAWSDGNVGAFGDSYSGTSAALLAAVDHPAVKVVIPGFNEFDVYTDIAYPGGVFNEAFVREWSKANDTLDRNLTPRSLFGAIGGLAVKGVAPVDGSEGRKLLKQAVAEHAANPDVFELTSKARFRDRRVGDRPAIDDFSLHRRLSALQKSSSRFDFWGSWMDAGTARAALAERLTIGGRSRAVIGPWSHGAGDHASPFLDPTVRTILGSTSRLVEQLRVFDTELRGRNTGLDSEPAIRYYTMGEEVWKSTDQWPPAGIEEQRWYFGAGRGLTASMGRSTASGADDAPIDFTVSSGTTNRWATQGSGEDVVYPDRAEVSARLLAYTSEPLEESIEISGSPVLHLFIASTTPENAIHAYLEQVGPSGRVTYLTEGLLNTGHREVDPNPPYWSDAPWLSHREADYQPMEPGVSAELVFALLPTSLVVPRGSRLRIALAGADSESFERLPATGDSSLEIHWGGDQASSLVLPSRPRPDLDALEPPLSLEAYAGIYSFGEGGSDRIVAWVDGGLLHFAGLDAAGAGRLSPTRFADYNGRAEALVEAVRGSKKVSRAALSEAVADAADIERLGDALKPVRKAVRVQVVATQELGGLPVTYLNLAGKPGEVAPFVLVWTDSTKQLVYAGLSQGAAGGTRFFPRSKGRFTSFDLRSYDAVEFEVDDSNKVRALILDGARAERR